MDFIERLLFNAIAEAALIRIVDFNSQEMANTVWAFATAAVSAQELFNAIAAEALKRIVDRNTVVKGKSV